ncbi:exosortase C-terminal domain/associated protein EpsI [Bradyrhizobium sp. RDT10]
MAFGSRKSGRRGQLSRRRATHQDDEIDCSKESRFEPVTYWLRIGNDIANGVVDHQLSRLKYGLRGIIPDGALIRVSTIGLPKDVSFKLQDQFIRDLLAAIPPQELKFFTGAS